MTNKNKELDSWPTLIKTFNRLHQAMEDQMKAAQLPSLEVYDVLWTLERAPEHSLRFNDLGKQVLLSRCNITRLAERLELQGLIKRERCSKDRRGVYAVLTPEGLELRKKMWVVYGRLIKESYSNLLSQDEHQMIIQILGKVWQEEKEDCL